MRILNIQIEQNGAMVPVGLIRGNDPGDACFEYFPEYLSRSDPAALSISLPLQREPFPPSQTASFFEGLLPEGFTRRSVAQWMHADEVVSSPWDCSQYSYRETKPCAFG